MIRSMTGFGSAETRSDEWLVQAEVRSVNHKGLRTSWHLPEAFRMKQGELQSLVEEQVYRGQLVFELSCRPKAGGGEVLIDRERLAEYLRALRDLAAAEEVPARFDLAALLSLPGALRDMDSDAELREQLWPHLEEVVRECLDSLVRMREAEGANLAEQLRGLCDSMGELVEQIEGHQADLVADYRDRLRERIEQLLEGTEAPIDEDVLAREVAVYADRSDVSEEIARMGSHLEQFRTLLRTDRGPVGRKMEFLGQEMLREAGTMSSKMPAGPQVQAALELKSQVERLREQVRNVE